MANELRFQDRWDFRRNEGEFHSSSDDSKSNDQPVSKKHKLVSSLVSDENDGTSYAPRLSQNVMEENCTVDPAKSKKRQTAPSKKGKVVKKDTKRKIESFRKVSRKKSKSNTDEPASLDSLKLFMESLMKDLHVASEELLVWVKEEMDKLMEKTTKRKPRRNAQETVKVKRQNNCESGLKLLADHTTHLSNVGSGSQLEKSHGGLLAQSFKSPKVADSNHPHPVPEKQGEHGQYSESDQAHHQNNIGSGWKVDKCNGSLAQSSKTHKIADSNHPNQMSEKQGEHVRRTESDRARHENNMIGSGWKVDKCNVGSLAQPLKSPKVADSSYPNRVAENQVESDQVVSSIYLTLPQFKTPEFNSSSYNQAPPHISANIERVNLTPRPSQHSFLMGMPKEHGVQNVNCFDQYTPITSGIGSGFPIPFHQGLNRRFSINQPQSHNNLLGLKMDGGSSNLSQQSLDYFSNNLQNNLGYKAYQNQNPKGDSLFPS